MGYLPARHGAGFACAVLVISRTTAPALLAVFHTEIGVTLSLRREYDHTHIHVQDQEVNGGKKSSPQNTMQADMLEYCCSL